MPQNDPAALGAAMQDALWAAVERLLFCHTNPWELDEALVAQGFEIGPCEAQDLVGLDVVRARQDGPVTPILSRMLAEGRMGKKGGVGYYRYPGRGGAVIDPLIEDLIREEAWFAKVERSEMSEAEMMACCLSPLISVGCEARGGGMDRPQVLQVLQQTVHVPAVLVAHSL